jgi:hypothetical protein
MITKTILAALAVISLTTTAGAAKASNWFMFGSQGSGPQEELDFYDAATVVNNNGHVRVWTKFLSKLEVDEINPNSRIGKQVMSFAAAKLNEYSPNVRNANFDAIIYNDAVADLSNITPRFKILYDIDCTNNTISILQTMEPNGAATGWGPGFTYLAPDTVGASLKQLVCPAG